MSAHYAPVTWNRQKRRYDHIMLLLMALFLIFFVGLHILLKPNISPETLIIRATGMLAFLMLHVILCIGPLARLDERFLPLLYNRRHLGVTMFLVALIHGIFNIVQLHALGNTDPLLSVFMSNTHYDSFVNFPFQTLGFFALLILFLMASTSHDFWLNNLSPKVWKSLHMLVYIAYALLVMHVMLGVVQLEKSPLIIGLVGVGLVTVTGLHVTAAIRGNRQDDKLEKTDNEVFIEVCNVEDIAENRAKVILVGNENIAIFKYDGKISAVNNVCKHQNGPLGEGKIVDGCITCPWHGYQYLPGNGQSPPPFTEKLATYRVKVMDGKVLVHPEPLPEGTAVNPALI